MSYDESNGWLGSTNLVGTLLISVDRVLSLMLYDEMNEMYQPMYEK